MDEQILVFPAENLNGFDFSKSVIKADDPCFKLLLDKTVYADNLSFVDRKPAETNPSLKQIIPYCVFMNDGKVFAYQRTKKSGEKRLVGKWSVAVGGHLSDQDVLAGDCDGRKDLNDIDKTQLFYNGLRREVSEEVGLDLEVANTEVGIAGCIFDDTTPVNAVHYGVCLIINLKNNTELQCKEETLTNGGFEKVEMLRKNIDMFEDWSKIVINNLL